MTLTVRCQWSWCFDDSGLALNVHADQYILIFVLVCYSCLTKYATLDVIWTYAHNLILSNNEKFKRDVKYWLFDVIRTIACALYMTLSKGYSSHFKANDIEPKIKLLPICRIILIKMVFDSNLILFFESWVYFYGTKRMRLGKGWRYSGGRVGVSWVVVEERFFSVLGMRSV